MKYDEVEVSDVVVVLEEERDVHMNKAVELLSATGLSVTDKDEDNDTIEGTIETDKIGALKKMPFVKYVRNVFTYLSERPIEGGDGQQDEEQDLEDVDDAGA